MKPRLDQRHGIWRCWSWAGRLIAGFGYTPSEAYEEWKRNTDAAAASAVNT